MSPHYHFAVLSLLKILLIQFLCFFSLFFSLFFFAIVDDAGCFAVVVVVEIIVTVGTVVAVMGFVLFSVGFLTGVFFPPFCTWVHPSSLSG